MSDIGAGAERGRVRLTGRGNALAATAVLALAVAALVGIQELYAIAAAALVLLGLATVVVAIRPLGLAATRQVVPRQVAAGESAAVGLTVTNHGRRASPRASLRDPFDLGHHVAAYRLAPLRAGESLTGWYHLPSTPRGRYQVGPLRVRATDPFGLVRRSALAAPASSLVVHPRLAHLDRPAGRQGFDRFGAGLRGTFEPGGDEFAALRPYRPGDDLRHVHWPSTARMEQVMVRQTDAVAEPRTTVAIDLRAGLWDPAGLEDALSAAGGVLEAANRGGMEVRLLTTPSDSHGPLDTGFGRSGAHWSAVLEALATIQSGPGGRSRTSLAGLLGAAGGSGGRRSDDTLMIITSSVATEADLRGLGRLAPEDSLIVVVFGDRSSPREPPEVAGRLVEVKELGKFAAVWDRLPQRAGRVAPR